MAMVDKNPGEFVDFDHQLLTVLTFDSDLKHVFRQKSNILLQLSN